MRRSLGRAVILLVSTVVAILSYSLLAEASPDTPRIPHGVSGYEQCLNCHSAEQIKPVPANHAAFDEDSCLSCHSSITVSRSENACLSCHGQPDLSMTLASGESLSLYVDSEVFAASIHGDKLLCTDCHSSISVYPHPEREIPSLREYNIAQYELCQMCHFDNYTKTLDSVHYDMLSSGDLQAPLCTDCHGAHNVTLPYQPRTKISLTCSKCHQNLYDLYASSVHGKALIEEANYDVPVCTDCHLSHTIEDPRTAAFHLKSVDLCSNCHNNEKLMQKYDISVNVVKTYLEDFHGATVALIGKQSKDIWAEEAVCTDCHGVHDIRQVDSPDSPVIKANLVNTCRKCHPEATANFPGAWLSHYEPSITKAPWVYLVRWFYRLLIPFILIGLSAHILLDLWRRITNR